MAGSHLSRARRTPRAPQRGSARAFFAVAAILAACAATAPPAHAAARDIFVSSRNTNSVKRFDGDTGAYLGDFLPAGQGNLLTPQEVRFGPDGRMYVTGLGNNRVKVYDPATGAWIGNFTSGYLLDDPTKMTFGPDGNLYVSQWAGTEKVVRFDGTTGASLGEFTSTSMVNPMDHAWDADGNLYVATWSVDGFGGDVRKFDPAGTFLGVFIDSSILQGPVNLWFEGGELRVVDWTTGSVERFDATTGAWLGTWISGLQNAEGYTWGPDGLFYVCDWAANVVNRYHPDGTLETAAFLGGGGMNHPNSITFAPAPPVDAPEARPAGESRLRVAPNPVRARTEVEFEMVQPGRVRLAVFDAAGRRVRTLLDGDVGAGFHAASWDAGAAPAGVYFVRLESAGGVRAEKVTRLQ